MTGKNERIDRSVKKKIVKDNFKNYKDGKEVNEKKDDNGAYFMFQLSFVGVEFGSKFRGFAEAGIGDQF